MKAEFTKEEQILQEVHSSDSILWLELPLSSTFYMKEDLL